MSRQYMDAAVRLKSSIPLDELLQLKKCDVDFINVQYGHITEDLEFFKKNGLTLICWNDLDITDQIDELAALIYGLDLVISINSTASVLSYSVGTPTWILVEYGLGSFRDIVFGADPWFEKNTIIRQPTLGDWQGLMKIVVDKLVKFRHEKHFL